MTAPFAVPTDDTTPYPVDFDRMTQAVHDMGFQVDVLVAGKAAGALFDDVPFLLSFDAQGRFLSVRAVWDTGLDPLQAGPHIFSMADGWNREKYFPTVYHMPSEHGTLQVCADFIVDTRAGIANIQLRENLGAGISTGISAIAYMKQAATESLDWSDPCTSEGQS